MTSDGTRQDEQRQPPGRARQQRWAAAGDDSQRESRAIVARTSAATPRSAVFCARSRDQLARPAGRYLSDSPRSNRTARPSHDAVLRDEWTIETEPVAFGRRHRGIHVERGQASPGARSTSSIAADETSNDEQRAEQRAPNEIAQESAAHGVIVGAKRSRRYRALASVSALHSNCGTCGAGVAFTTRAVVAMEILGATK